MDIEKLKLAKERLAERKVADEVILVPLSDNVAELDAMFTLNDVGTFIWETLHKSENVDEIVEAVCSEFEVEPRVATNDVVAFLEELSQFIAKQ